MAELMAEEDGNDKNFILAKLVSIFSDSVDFDVINIVAQENEWNETKCIESLTMLGEYTNSPSVGLHKEIESIQLCNQVSDTAIAKKREESSINISIENMSQNKKTSAFSAASSKAPKSSHSASGATNEKEETTHHRYPSPAPTTCQKSKERSTETQEHHDQVKNLIKSGTPVLILLRGLPGSGKSSLSKQLLALPGGKSGCTCSADDFFLVPQGGKGHKEYHYDPLRLEDAHKHCRVQVLRAIAHGVSPIIVDNTNTQAWEMLPYVDMALEPWKAEDTLRNMVANGTISKRNICNSLGSSRSSFRGKKCNCGFTVMERAAVPYQVELLEPLTWWYQNPARLAKVNQHGVSQRKITQMLSHFEYGLTGKDLIKQVLKKKQCRKFAFQPEPQNHPVTKNVRPFKEKKPSAHPPTPPLFPARANHGNTRGNNLPSKFVTGNNQLHQSPMNHLINFVEFSSGPYTQPVLYSPVMSNIDSGDQTSELRSTETKLVNPREQLHLTCEEIQGKHLSNNSQIFPGIEPSTLFPCQESEQNIDPDESSSMNASSKSGKIGPNPFLNVMNTSNEGRDTSSIYQGECIEISEEEEREWMQANASKYVDWKSSGDEESGDELINNFYEPKPARSTQGDHANLKDANGSITGTETSNCQHIEGEEEIAKWVADEGGDHLASWCTPSDFSNSGNQTADTDSVEAKEHPLPPRRPKNRILVENSPKGMDGSDQEKAPNPIGGHGFDWIKDIRLLLKALGLDKDNSESVKQSSNETENTVGTKSTAVESDPKNDEPPSVPKNKDSVHSILSQSEVQIDLNNENIMLPKTEGTVKSGSSNVKIHGGSDNGCSPLSATSVPLNNPIDEYLMIEPTVMAADSSLEKVGKNNQLADVIDVCQPDSEKIILSDIAEASRNPIPVKVFDEFHHGQLELKDSSNQLRPSTPEASISDGKKTVSSEKSDHNIIKGDITSECETQNLETLNHDNFNSCDDKSETQSLHDKTDQVKMSVLMSLMIGIEKAQQRNPEEFESSAKLGESVQTGDTKSETCQEQLEEGKSQSLASGDLYSESTSTTDVGDDAGSETEVNTSEAQIIGPANIFGTIDENSKESRTRGKCKEHTMYQSKVCECDFMKEPHDKGLSSAVTPSSKELSPPFVFKQNNNGLLNNTDELLNLAEEGNDDDSFLIVTNQDATMHSDSSYPFGGVSYKSEAVINPMDIQGNGIKITADLPLVEESMAEKINPQGDQTECVCHSTCKNSDQATASNVLEKEDFLSKRFATKSLISPTLDSAYSVLSDEIGAPEPSKVFSNIEDVDVGKKLFPNVNSDSVEADGILNCDVENDETYPLVLDQSFVDLLYKTFGNPYEEPLYESSKLPSGQTSSVSVNIPASLARKLHECLLRSQWDSILTEDEASQKMMIEDELLARQLQELEKEDLKDLRRNHRDSPSTTPNLREIMDMEKAMAVYKADQDKMMHTNQRNDMSTRLTWDLLVKEFPQIPQNVIAQIFSAYDYSYANVREALLTSLPEYESNSHATAVKDVVSPEAIAVQEKILLEKAKMESLKFQQRGMLLEEDDDEVDEMTDETELNWKEMVEEARKSAALNRKLQKERHAQAQAANRSGMASAAAYYCQMATLHKQKAEEETRNAAHILSKVFTGKYGSSSGKKVGSAPPLTLDMHSMKVLEAVTVMNAFLDAHIEWLQAERTRQHGDNPRKSSPTKTKTLFLVTGRGINSQGGIPRIKPAVERQLEMRGIWYEEMNPGLLRVMVSANQPMKMKV